MNKASNNNDGYVCVRACGRACVRACVRVCCIASEERLCFNI